MLVMRPGCIYLETCYKKNKASYTIHARVEDKRHSMLVERCKKVIVGIQNSNVFCVNLRTKQHTLQHELKKKSYL